MSSTMSLAPKALEFFDAINSGDSEKVRHLLAEDKTLVSLKHKSDNYKYDSEVELDAYKFLGAYLGSLTGLQVSLLKGNDSLAKDIIDLTLNTTELEIPFGGGNTALHLATFVGARDVVRKLLGRGVDRNSKNNKGFKAIDVLDDAEMREIYNSN